jgi:putative transcriptional regulator
VLAQLVHLDRLLYRRALTLTELSKRVGLTVANLSILKTGKARAVRFSTLEAICRELDCQPGDLLEYVATGDAVKPRPGLTGQTVRIDEEHCDLTLD